MAQGEEEVGADRALVLDANIVLRAVLGTRVRSLIERYGVSVPLFLPASCLEEVREYLPSLCAKRCWEIAPAVALLEALLAFVRVADPAFYGPHEYEARRRIGFRDVEDWPVVALALALEAPVWTEDSDFFGSGVATWTTETVEIYLSDDPWQVHEPPPPAYGGGGVEQRRA